MGRGGGRARIARGVVLCALLGLAGAALAEDWPVYRHDLQSTGASQETLSASQAAQLSALWNQPSAVPIANPVAVGGSVYVTADTGRLLALDASTGAIRWQHNLAITGTFTCNGQTMASSWEGPIGAPAVVGTHVYFPSADGAVYSFDAATGAQQWRTVIANPYSGNEFLWSSAFPLNGKLYIGVGTLFEESCGEAAGRIAVLDQATGSVVGTWWATSNQGPGAGIWAQPSYDPETNRLFITTGNPQQGYTASQQPLSQAIVAIDPNTLQTLDSNQPVTTGFYTDADFGTGPTLFDLPDGRKLAVATNKNGYVYAWDRTNLRAGPLWSFQISGPGASPDLGEGSIAAPAYANGLVFAGGGKTTDGYPGAIAALDAATGQPRWVIHPDGFVLPALTAVGGVVAVGLSNATTGAGALLVLDQQSGATVFRQNTPSKVFAEPTFANGVLYFGDVSSSFWALKAPTSSGGTPDAGSVDAGTPDAGSFDAGSSGVLFQDGFNHTGGLGSSWSVGEGGWSDNGSAAISTAAHGYAYWNGGKPADSTVGITVVAPRVGTYAGVVARATALTDSRNHYAAYLDPSGVLSLARRNDWSYTYLATGATFSNANHRLELTVSGSGPVSLTVKVDGAVALQYSDASSAALTAAGYDGIFDFNGASQPLDDFAVSAPGASTTTTSGSSSSSSGSTGTTTTSGSSSSGSTTGGSTTGGSTTGGSTTTSGSTSGGTTGSSAINLNVTASPGFSSATAPFSVELDATTSTVSDPNDWIAAFKWTLSDGASGTAGWIDHTFQSAGTYTATVTATDGYGNTASKTVTIQVGSTSTTSGSTTSGSTTGGSTTGGSTTGGSTTSGSTTSGSTSGGSTGSTGMQPVAVITGGPFSGAAPLNVYLDATTSYCKSSGCWIGAFSWSFGDGTTSTAAWGTHTFKSAGSYTVTLTAFAGDGTKSTATQVVTVSP